MARRGFLFRGRHRDRQVPGCTTAMNKASLADSERRERRFAVADDQDPRAILSCPPPWCVFDCQTTGVDAGLRLIDASIVDHYGNILFDTLINPDIHIPTSASVLTGIDDAAVSRAPRWSAIWSKLEDLFLSQNRVFVWSAEFDLRAMRGECGRRDDLAWTTAIDARFVDLTPIVATFAGYECSFEDACAIASCPIPAVGQQRALRYCRSVMRMIQFIQSLSRSGKRSTRLS
jgi:hypothetical protein